MDAQANAGWANRVGSTTRIALIVVTALFGLFALGMVAGFSYAVVENGRLPTKPLTYLIFAAMFGLLAISVWVLVSLIRSIRPETLSGFDRRYWKMWVVLAALSIPLLIGIAALSASEDSSFVGLVLSSSPITPMTAVLGSILLSTVAIVSMIIYFRAIDDHEERAYLWGSNLAFHFLALAFPLYWLLARGGLVPTLTIGIALLIVLLSIIVQVIVWALFKFR